MTDESFKLFYTSLLYYYGKKKEDTTADVNRAYFEVLKPVSDAQREEFFKKVVKAFVYFPRVAELKELVPPAKPAEFRNTTLCWHCMDLGYIPYTKTVTDGNIRRTYDFIAQCPMCEAGGGWNMAPSYTRLFGEEALREVKRKNMETFSHLEQTVPQAKEKFDLIVKAVCKGAKM